ncbi:MAG: hypothetical protein MJ170_00845 [Alphaproteobacteria bacterium]|nr:hypothetical protein [Alphaproteobacteria bacterium]
MVDFREITAVEGIYIPENLKKEAFGADILVERGVFTLLVRYQYRTKNLALKAVEALKKRDSKLMPHSDLPQKVYIVGNTKVK